MKRYYNRELQPISEAEAERLLSIKNYDAREIAADKIELEPGTVWVQTVFTVEVLAYRKGEPVLFKTVILDRNHLPVWRSLYLTEAEAIQGHGDVLSILINDPAYAQATILRFWKRV